MSIYVQSGLCKSFLRGYVPAFLSATCCYLMMSKKNKPQKLLHPLQRVAEFQVHNAGLPIAREAEAGTPWFMVTPAKIVRRQAVETAKKVDTGQMFNWARKTSGSASMSLTDI